MTPNEAVEEIWSAVYNRPAVEQIVREAIATATAELRGEILTLREDLEALRSKSISQQAKLAAAERLVAKWLERSDTAEKIGRRSYDGAWIVVLMRRNSV